MHCVALHTLPHPPQEIGERQASHDGRVRGGAPVVIAGGHNNGAIATIADCQNSKPLSEQF